MAHDQFDQMFPGPYVYVPGTNGVDETFDVTCTRTKTVVAYATYWYERESAEAIAYAVTQALNRHCRPIRSRFTRVDREKLRRFQKDHFGPYSVLVVRHNPEHFEIGIADQKMDTLFIAEESSICDPDCIAYFQWLARILNQAFGHDDPEEDGAYHFIEAPHVSF